MIEHLPLLAIYIKTKDLNADRKLMKIIYLWKNFGDQNIKHVIRSL